MSAPTHFDNLLETTTVCCCECQTLMRIPLAAWGPGDYWCGGGQCVAVVHVCVCGSLNIGRAPQVFFDKLEALIQEGVAIEIGDAPGGDKTAQRYLAGRGYRNVTVWHIGLAPRNNLGHWPTHPVRGTYRDRDYAMCAASTRGLALWNGTSPGTARNRDQLGDRMDVVRV